MKRQQPLLSTRRDFLKTTGAGVAILAAGSQLVTMTGVLAAEGEEYGDSWAVLVDTTRCVGCSSCALACREVNQLPDCDVKPTQLDCYAFSVVERHKFVDASGGEDTVFVKRQCMHCLHPACVSACTVGALRKTPEGPVVYDSEKCIGCRYCQYACPFGIPTYEWNSPVGLIHKCQLCVNRLEEGQQPACIAACPTGALRFSKRDALLAQAHAQILSNPGRYVDHVYGEYEIGGTSVLYLSGVPFVELGLPDLDSRPIPYYAEAVMKSTPVVAGSVALLATGLYWFMKRRELRLEQDVQLPGEKGESS